MKYAIFLLCCCHYMPHIFGQPGKGGKVNLGVGLSAPELAHVAINYRIANISQIGMNFGAAPSLHEIWPAISLEHRLYLGRNDIRTTSKTWFFRQGTTLFTNASSPQRLTLTLSGGKDIPFKKVRNGITIDAGVFYLADSGNSSIILVRSLNLWPALRIQLYGGL